MADVELFIKFDSETVDGMLARLEAATSPVGMAAFLQGVITPMLQQRAQRRFDMEGDDVSGPWLPLTDATNSIRESQGYPPEHPINRRSGQLERYITSGNANIKFFPGGALLTYPGTPAVGELATKLKTAQEGKSRPLTPPRPVLGMNEVDLAYATTALEQWIRSAESRWRG